MLPQAAFEAAEDGGQTEIHAMLTVRRNMHDTALHDTPALVS